MKMNILGALVLSLAITLTNAQSNNPDAQSPKVLESRGIDAMGEGRYLDAAHAFSLFIKERPKSFVGYYNLSAAMSRANEPDASVQAMTTALSLGFSDKRQLLLDPDLAILRKTEFFRSVIGSWDAVVEARRANDLAHVSKLINRKRESRTHERYKMEMISAHGPKATDDALQELDLLARWAIDELFPTQRDPAFLDDSPWVMIALPDKKGFLQWAVTVFGPGVRGSISSVGGAYEFQNRRLVAQDLGATFRHEFIHVLHWRDMNANGQVHAPWIQEGLASLVEDYDMHNGDLVPVPSWRTNMVKRLLDVRKLPEIETLATTKMDQFTSNKPLAKYAQARTIMLYLLEQNKLGAFYQRYLATYKSDRFGIQALEETLDLSIGEIEEKYREWISKMPNVAETGTDLSATLGIGVENGAGDGVVVSQLPGRSRTRTGLHTREVIYAINDRPTRDLFEFIRVLGSYAVGETIKLSTRRGTKHNELHVQLLAR